MLDDPRSWRFAVLQSVWTTVGLMLAVTVAAAEEARPEPRLIVVLYPQNNDGSPGNFVVDQSIRAVFAEESSAHVEIHNEYLDCSSPAGKAGSDLQRDYLTRKYAGRRVDVVIAGMSPALDFLLEHRGIFAGAPVVFCAVDQQEVQTRRLPPDVIGVPVKFDLEATLDLALRLHPKTTSVAVIAGSAPMDMAWERRARAAFQHYEDSRDFRYLSGLPLDKLRDEVAQLPQESVIYYLHVFNDGTGRTLVPAHVLETLAESSHVPIYGHVDTYVGRGIVGGRVFSFEQEGRNAAHLAQRIMAGESPEQIGVQEVSSNTDMFDHRQLQRWRIREASLPDGSTIRHREPEFWKAYKWWIAGTVALCCLQTLLIVGLLVQRTLRRRAEANVRMSQRDLQQLSNSLIGAQENERRRIARELHDDFNQRLALLSVELDLIRQKPPESMGEVRRRMSELSDQVRDLSTSIHDLSHELHPLKLEQLGLVTAIRSLCHEVAHSHELDIRFIADPLPDAIPSETALCLYRIVQEALRNVIKHSRAAGALVQITADADGIRLSIADRGVGFVQNANSQSGLGFISMRERLRLVGGELTIESSLSEGTRLDVRTPLPFIVPPDRELKVELVAVP
ncbi:MAG: hypothetical protein KF861_09275 [Planctomycetaceae bacterium]|nr:hypothetical protein [Planctomycetaceae bacterium]